MMLEAAFDLELKLIDARYFHHEYYYPIQKFTSRNPK